MTSSQSDRTASPDGGAKFPPSGGRGFADAAEPFRRQIKAYCYRMMGSLHEAEDLTQETFLKAWRAFNSFQGRGSLKAWLYQIATRVCLDALRQRKHVRRMLPEAQSPPAAALPSGQPSLDEMWLEPYPDSELDDVSEEAAGPEIRYERHESVRLAFIAAIQYLPPRQRAILLLIDVLGWSPGETATLIGGSVASINSALQRARATLTRHYPEGGPDRHHDFAVDQSALLDRYVQAWEAKDLDGFVALLKEDASYAMPPYKQWYQGRIAIRRFLAAVWGQYGRFRLLRTAANGQPAFVLYTQNGTDGTWAPHSIHLLTLSAGGIAKLTLFMKPMGPRLARAFGFAATPAL
ncbi:MAG TPA: sigma-70 family RNA polymerase sigma factor [Steroidobacteraceae bacterium]|jgi:RNA polymerase sigma-70 factor (ECF subfamily)